MKLMTPEQWAMHINAVNDFHEDAFQEEITWMSTATNRSYHGEDSNHREIAIQLKCLVLYNYFRSWPIDQATDSGEIDKQSCMAIFNIKYLQELGYLNEFGQFDINQGDDKFILNGLVYVPSGDSQVSQAYNNPLMTFIVLKREEINTGDQRY